MKLKELKELQKNLDGDLTVMIPDGKGGYVEAGTVRVEEFEMEDLDDEEVLVIDD